MSRILLIAVAALAVTACASDRAVEGNRLAMARAQLLAHADDPARATFEGLDAEPAPGGAVCGRMFDTGPGRQPVRFVLEPVAKRVLLDPASTQSLTGAQEAIENCETVGDDRSSTFESREPICRPAEVMDRETKLRRAFEARFNKLCS